VKKKYCLSHIAALYPHEVKKNCETNNCTWYTKLPLAVFEAY